MAELDAQAPRVPEGRVTWLAGVRYRIVSEARGPHVLHDEKGRAIGAVQGVGYLGVVPV